MKYLVTLGAVISVILPVFSAMAQEKVSVTREDCANLVGYRAPNDIVYQPGVDVNGNKVVAAEGDGPTPVQIELPKKIVIDFGIDLAGSYGISGTGDQTATAKLFAVEYDMGMGELRMNGKPLNQDDSRIIAKACKMFLHQKDDKTPKKPQK